MDFAMPVNRPLTGPMLSQATSQAPASSRHRFVVAAANPVFRDIFLAHPAIAVCGLLPL
jgi:hypothetical protein